MISSRLINTIFVLKETGIGNIKYTKSVILVAYAVKEKVLVTLLKFVNILYLTSKKNLEYYL